MTVSTPPSANTLTPQWPSSPRLRHNDRKTRYHRLLLSVATFSRCHIFAMVNRPASCSHLPTPPFEARHQIPVRASRTRDNLLQNDCHKGLFGASLQANFELGAVDGEQLGQHFGRSPVEGMRVLLVVEEPAKWIAIQEFRPPLDTVCFSLHHMRSNLGVFKVWQRAPGKKRTSAR